MDSKDSTWEGIVIMSWLVSRMLVALFPSKKWELIATSQENMAKPTEQKKKFSALASSSMLYSKRRTEDRRGFVIHYIVIHYSLFCKQWLDDIVTGG